jgi:hypothetical protein
LVLFFRKEQSSYVNSFMRRPAAFTLKPPLPHSAAGDCIIPRKVFIMDNNTKPIEVLTEEQAAQVAGGLIIIVPNPVLGTGCRTCTSGVQPMFRNEAASLAK